jgi:carboxymethylenebutenolidase
MRTTVLLLTMLLFASSLLAADRKQVTYKSGDETVQGMLYTPSGKGPFPAIVAIHEWWGLNDWVKEQASKLADQGYVVLAVDLYRGKVADNPELAHELMRGVPDDRAKRDLLAATAYLRSQKNVRPDKVGTIGWCMGGGYANTLALSDPKLAAASIHYGHISTDKEAMASIHAAIQGIFGGKDRGIPVEDVNKWEATLKELGKDVQVTIYPDAGHAFENPAAVKAGLAFNAADAADAWKKTVDFFAAKLKK